jgi:hypothetical protein
MDDEWSKKGWDMNGIELIFHGFSWNMHGI